MYYFHTCNLDRQQNQNSIASCTRWQPTHFSPHNCMFRRTGLNIVYFLLGISPASMYNMPTFRNHVSVPSSKAGSRLCGVRKGEAIHGSETSAYYTLTLGKYPKENIQYSNHGESLKSTTGLKSLNFLNARNKPINEADRDLNQDPITIC